ncbi:hypothetical protein Q31a_26970 [Aureliella helgolandensis]|uniref:HTH cro/C1-type domain-containing protein n=1 Tax=Aureliella helgolandensis TaxID=2527968 RepID=A0A518G716_9BACT|nr:hypothetical protein Q31a_26970 [Aureliella helgolandensis]
MNQPADQLQAAIAKRAEQMGLTPYALAKLCEGKPSEDTIRRYLSGGTTSSSNAARLCDVLQLTLTPKRKANQ